MAPGFQLNPREVGGHAKTACDLADDLRSTRTTWNAATQDGGRACGVDVAAKAFTAMQDAWFDEIGVHITVLEQACEALRDSAKQAGSDDQAAADALRGDSDVQ